MNVLVIGGTRGLGRAIITAAHAAGHVLTVLARRPSEFAPDVVGVRLVIGDVTDPLDVERAMPGQHAVVWAARAAGVREVDTTYSRGTHNVLQAMRAGSVRRFVCVTGTQPSRRQALMHPGLARTLAEESRRQERQVRASDTEWTLVVPAALSNRAPTSLYQMLDEAPDGRARPVARRDVAQFVVESLATADCVYRTVYLCG